MADKVFELVKSLTKSEQRYFYRYAHQHRQDRPNYWKVYEVIMGLPTWDEQEFKSSLQQETFFKHLPVIKSHLYDRLLDALHLYHREQEVEEQIKRALHQAYLLHKRGLRLAFRQHLKKCRRLIETNQLWIFWPEFMSLEQLNLESPSSSPTPSKSAERWAAEYQRGLDQIEMGLPAAALKTELAQVHVQRVRPDQQQIQAWEQTLGEIKPGPDRQNRANLQQCTALLAFMQRDAPKAAAANKKLLEILEQQSPDQRLVPERYLSTLYNFLIDQLQLGKIDAFQQGLLKLRQLPNRKGFKRVKGIQRKTFEWGFQLELNHLVQNKAYQQALARLPELAEGLKAHQSSISPQAEAGLRHLAGLIAFQERKPQLALDFITPLYQKAKPKVAHEIYHYAELLYILCHFELEHLELSEHLISSFQRRLRHQKDRHQASLDCLSFIKKLQQAVNKKEQIRIWQQWQLELVNFPPAILIYLDLGHWITQKLP